MAAVAGLKKTQKALTFRFRLCHTIGRVLEWRYRGRVVTADDITSIRQLIAENPGARRRRLSERLCEAWQWRQANGALRAMVCRGLLLMRHRAREIQLPPVRFKTLRPFVVRATPTPMLIDTTPIMVAF
jgi:hypothetical protein